MGDEIDFTSTLWFCLVVSRAQKPAAELSAHANGSNLSGAENPTYDPTTFSSFWKHATLRGVQARIARRALSVPVLQRAQAPHVTVTFAALDMSMFAERVAFGFTGSVTIRFIRPDPRDRINPLREGSRHSVRHIDRLYDRLEEGNIVFSKEVEA